ncbi:MAG: hypothetical protein COY80_01940 [Candidatus Pacebacteria bacterium CG_4_10_14_0_8_um_filter_42_14]|nr:MAG: hypothetical protein COY80_01940 [Candidatus Pacebacteria bacterium CG_4_10_14_0_8_um_filter_42_14]
MKNFTRIPNQILNQSQISYQARYVFCLLLKYCGQKDYCYPSQDRLAKDMGISDRQIRAHLNELCLAGLIKKQRTGFNKTNTYTITKHFQMSGKPDSPQLGSKFPLDPGTTLPPKNTYIKGQRKMKEKGMQIIRDTLEKKGLMARNMR